MQYFMHGWRAEEYIAATVKIPCSLPEEPQQLHANGLLALAELRSRGLASTLLLFGWTTAQ